MKCCRQRSPNPDVLKIVVQPRLIPESDMLEKSAAPAAAEGRYTTSAPPWFRKDAGYGKGRGDSGVFCSPLKLR